jgi:transposase InsO family protein
MIAPVPHAEPASEVQHLCEVFGVSRSWYYERQQPSARQLEETRLRAEIEEVILEFPGYGYRRVTHALRRAGWQVKHKRVLRLMREESLLCHLRRHFVPQTTQSDHTGPSYPNLLTEVVLSAPNQVWVADLTYIRLQGEFVYLAAILDAWSRRCVGWHLGQQLTADLTQAALTQALALRCPPPGLIHHSDRGVQYACRDYLRMLEQAQARPSMSRTGNPYDNAKAESFFKTLKREEVWLKEYLSFADAQANLAHFIEQVYNHKRLHSSLGYLPPVEFEAQYDSEGAVALSAVR